MIAAAPPPPAENHTDGIETASDAGAFVVPGDLHLAPASRARMHHQLAGQPTSVVGIVAPRASLPPGSSVITVAERADLRPDSQCHASPTGPAVPGAVLIRSGVRFEVQGETVEIDPAGTDPAAALVIDPGAVAVAPPTPDLADAVADGRPPFRWRPVVLFLAGDDDRPAAAAAARTADALILVDVEARLAIHSPTPTSRLTQACLATRASVEALRPDVIVALDATALERAERWSPTRSTVVVAWDPGLGASTELVSWTLGSARGRLRARIGPDVEVGALAALLNRLCSGPHPAPPDDAPADVAVPVEVRTVNRSAEPTTRRLRLLGDRVGSGPLGAGLIDQFVVAGYEVVDGPGALADPGGDGHELALTDPATARRSDAGDRSSTIIVVERHDAASIRAGAIDRAWWRGRPVVVADRRTAHELRGLHAHPMVVPILLPHAEVASLSDAAQRRIRPPVPTIGWILDTDTDTESAGAQVRRSATLLEDLVERVPEASIEIVGLTPDEVTALDLPDRVSRRAGPPDPTGLASWTAQVWLPADGSLALTGDLRTLARAALAGVPTALVLTDHGVDGPATGGLADPQLVLAGSDDPRSWCTAVAMLITDDARRDARSLEGIRRARALYEVAAARHTIHRVIGWFDARRSS